MKESIALDIKMAYVDKIRRKKITDYVKELACFPSRILDKFW